MRTLSPSFHAWILVGAFGVAYFLAQFSPVGTPMRWPIYGLPLVSVGIWLLTAQGRGLQYDRRHLKALLVYFSLVLVSAIFSPSMDFEFFRDTLIISGIFLTFIPIFKIESRVIKALFSILCFSFFLETVIKDREIVFSFDLIVSRGFAESTVAFPLSIMVLYFAYRKEWGWLILAVVSSLFAFKRIAVLGLAVALFFYVFVRILGRVWRYRATEKNANFFAISAVTILALTALNLNSVVDYIFTIFEIRTSPNGFTLGRYYINEIAGEVLEKRDLINWLFGSGAGSADKLVSSLNVGLDNMHNDYQKLFFEYGAVGVPLMLFALFGIYSGNKLTLSILVFNAALMVTDNTIIYYFHQFVSFLVVRAIQQETVGAGSVYFARPAKDAGWAADLATGHHR